MASTSVAAGADFVAAPVRPRLKPFLSPHRAFFPSSKAKKSRRLLAAAVPPAVERRLPEDVDSAGKIEDWMRDSISEIVKHVGEAPLLVHLFARGGGLTIEREAASPESWPQIKKRWGEGGQPRPDGVILVEELPLEQGSSSGRRRGAGGGRGRAPASEAKTWGLVVQGRGMDTAACYVLDTCRVPSAFGFCTHFCLARAQCYGDSPAAQLRNVWLQQSGR